MIKEGSYALWPTPEGDVKVAVIQIKDGVAEVQWPDMFRKGEFEKAKIAVNQLKEAKK